MIEFNFFFYFILVSYFAYQLLQASLNLLDLKNLHQKSPSYLTDLLDAAKVEKINEYNRTNLRFSLLKRIYSVLIFLFLWWGKIFPLMFSWAESLVSGKIWTALVFVGILSSIQYLLGLPWGVYSTFVIEEKFGFNRSTWKTFFSDQIKGAILGIIIGAPILALLLFCFESLGSLAWLYSFLITAAFTLTLTYIAPTLIMPLFNKFTPLEENDFYQKIKELAQKCAFPLAGIYVMDASKRSSKGNAFFTGFGKQKRIVFFDTLLKQHDDDELLAVLAHEIGHNKKKHTQMGVLFSILQMFITFFLLGIFINNLGLVKAFGFEATHTIVGMVLFTYLYQPAELISGVLSMYISRKNEYEADEYACQAVGETKSLTNALKKLLVDNYGNLNPHPMTVFFSHSHPTVGQRIAAMMKLKLS